MLSKRRTRFRIVMTREMLLEVPTGVLSKVDKFVENCFAQVPIDWYNGWYDTFKFQWWGVTSAEITKAAVTVMSTFAKGEWQQALMMIDIYKDRRVTNAPESEFAKKVSHKSNQEETS